MLDFLFRYGFVPSRLLLKSVLKSRFFLNETKNLSILQHININSLMLKVQGSAGAAVMAFLLLLFSVLVILFPSRSNRINNYQNYQKIFKENKKRAHILSLSTLIVYMRKLLYHVRCCNLACNLPLYAHCKSTWGQWGRFLGFLFYSFSVLFVFLAPKSVEKCKS